MVYSHIQKIKSIQGTNDKLAQLKLSLYECPILEKVFHCALSTELQYGIKKIPVYSTKPEPLMSLDSALDVLINQYSTNKLTGNARINDLQLILSNLSENDAEVIKLVLDKSLDCGISTTNANKILKTPIKTFNVMLCGKRTPKLDKTFNIKNAIAQTKSDGMRVIISIDENGQVKYRTRNGKELQFNDKLYTILSKYKGKVFDGEALIRKDGKLLDRKTGNGILNSIQQGKANQEDIDSVVFMLWDVVPYDEFFSNTCSTKYQIRFNVLQQIVLHTEVHSFTILPEYRICESWADAEEFYAEQRAKGEEGIIVKDLNGTYEAKRVNHQIKMKAEETADLIIIDIIEGTGKHEGKLGAITCATECGELKVNVGTGFSDELREYFWNNQDSLIGEIVEVKYNEVIKSKGKETASLFLPVFVEIRTDKNTANTIKELK